MIKRFFITTLRPRRTVQGEAHVQLHGEQGARAVRAKPARHEHTASSHLGVSRVESPDKFHLTHDAQELPRM